MLLWNYNPSLSIISERCESQTAERDLPPSERVEAGRRARFRRYVHRLAERLLAPVYNLKRRPHEPRWESTMPARAASPESLLSEETLREEVCQIPRPSTPVPPHSKPREGAQTDAGMDFEPSHGSRSSYRKDVPVFYEPLREHDASRATIQSENEQWLPPPPAPTASQRILSADQLAAQIGGQEMLDTLVPPLVLVSAHAATARRSRRKPVPAVEELRSYSPLPPVDEPVAHVTALTPQPSRKHRKHKTLVRVGVQRTTYP